MGDRDRDRGRAIILVEDNPDDEALTLRALRKASVANEVVVAHDGAEAVDLIFSRADSDRTPLGLVLLDLNLPKIAGLEVLRRRRADERTRLVPVALLTSSSGQENIIAAY